jgi:CheY-specific phosphatase CheX
VGVGHRPMRVHLDKQCVINASESFWLQMLAMTLDPIKSPAEPFLGAGHIHAGVELSGAWLGRIEVRMAERLAYEATASMMMQAVETVKQEDALDAVREIANMIAGVIKPALPRPCSMTVPQSAIESEYFCSGMRAGDSLAVGFRHRSGDLLVQVWENEYAPEP